MVNIRDKLLERLGKTGEVSGYLGNGAAPQPTVTSTQAAQKLVQRAEARRYEPLEADFVFDTTGSMSLVIDKVRSHIEQIGSELLGTEKSLEGRVIGVGDHCDARDLQYAGVTILGDYGQDNPVTKDMRELKNQISRIVNTSGGDTPEAYECMAYDLAARIRGDKTAHPNKKHVVVFFGDASPHGAKVGGDNGCPYQRGPQQLAVLVAMADHTYFVECGSGQFEEHTYGAVQGSPKATLIHYQQARQVLPESIIGMVKLIQGPEVLQQYLALLGGNKAQAVAGLLTAGNPGALNKFRK